MCEQQQRDLPECRGLYKGLLVPVCWKTFRPALVFQRQIPYVCLLNLLDPHNMEVRPEETILHQFPVKMLSEKQGTPDEGMMRRTPWVSEI